MQQVRRKEGLDTAPASVRIPPSPAIQRKPIVPVAAIARGRLPVPVSAGALVPVRRRGGIMVRLGNLWVLHKKAAGRAVLALVLALIAFAVYVTRDELSQGFEIAANLVTGRIADAGFGVESIEISGIALTREADIARAIGIREGMTSFEVDIAEARERIAEIPSVETVTIRKVYPDSLIVTITEKTPVARWRIDGATMLIDAGGHPIAPARVENGELPLVIGEGAGDDAQAMINLMQRYPDLTFDLAALSRIGDRRWDLIFYSGLRVQLPETGVVDALNRLNDYQIAHQLLDRDIELVDMRVPQYVAVRPTNREAPKT